MRSTVSASRSRLAAAIGVPLVIAVGLAWVLVSDQRQRAQLQTDAAVRGDVAGAVSVVRSAIADLIQQASTAPVPGERRLPAGGVTSAGASTAVLIQARDSGTAGLDDTVRPAAIVLAVYAPGRPTGSTEERRAAVTGYRLVPLDLQSELAGLAPQHGGLAVAGPDRTVTAVPAAAPAGARTFAADMDLAGAPGWTVQGWLPAPPLPAITWFWMLVLVVVFGGLATVLVLLVRRAAALASQQQRMERERSLVSGLAPYLQSSLDLGEVVPAVASHLADGLTLGGLSLSVPAQGGERAVFGWGLAPDATVVPGPVRPGRLERGSTVALALRRGGRVLGILRVLVAEPLASDDVVALATAAELLGSTLANAEAFARQQELVERMRSVDELKTVFLATASHELRTPVTAIVGFSQLLVDRWDTMDADQGRQLMERVLANGRRLDTLIEQLLDFSQLERGLPRTGDAVVDLGATIARILVDQPELAVGHELRTELADGCTVRGSRPALERIVTNLVGNAAKYAPAGTCITVTCGEEGGRALILVDDEGPGVAEEDRDRVFSRFYRGRGESVARTRGAGIGLAIVAEYVAALAGTVSVERAPSGGARFRVSLPVVGALAAAASGGAADDARS